VSVKPKRGGGGLNGGGGKRRIIKTVPSVGMTSDKYGKWLKKEAVPKSGRGGGEKEITHLARNEKNRGWQGFFCKKRGECCFMVQKTRNVAALAGKGWTESRANGSRGSSNQTGVVVHQARQRGNRSGRKTNTRPHVGEPGHTMNQGMKVPASNPDLVLRQTTFRCLKNKGRHPGKTKNGWETERTRLTQPAAG